MLPVGTIRVFWQQANDEKELIHNLINGGDMKFSTLILATVGTFLTTPAFADSEVFTGPYFGEVIRVIDGDTFEASIALWPTIAATVSVRLRGYDAPESFRPACPEEALQAVLATNAMEEVLPIGQEILIENVERDPFFGRVVADVSRVANVNSYSLAVLLENREAVQPWDPSQPDIDWCPEG